MDLKKDGETVGFTGGLEKKVTITADDIVANVQPAPIRGIQTTSGGTVVVTLWGNDPNVAGDKTSLVLVANVPETRYIIKKIWLTGSTLTGLQAWE